MGSKGAQSAPAPVYSPPPPDPLDMTGPILEMMGGMMASVMDQQNALVASLNIPPIPPISEASSVDWEARREAIKNALNDDRENTPARGRASTILTSLLDNEDEPSVLDLELRSGQ